jgi:hypothetical protein
MTGRERLQNIINKKPVDRIAWSTLIDDRTRMNMSPDVQALSPFDFYRYIGCDHFTYGGYGFGDIAYKLPVRCVTPGITQDCETGPDNISRFTTKSPFGSLTFAYGHGSHPVEYRIKTIGDLRIFKNIQKTIFYEPVVDGTNESWNRLNNALGDLGIYCEFMGTSPLQNLIEFETGMENFYYFLEDYPKEMEELFDIMHENLRQMYDIYAKHSPTEVVMPVENTSSMMISPELYRRYCVPQLRDYADILHRHEKKMILHMCGHLKNLLAYAKETNLDGINALTPPPIGDTPCELALDLFGDDFVLLGACFNGAVFHGPSTTADDIHRELDRLYTPRIRKANMVLSLPADGLPTDVWRFLAVRDWMEKYGKN